MKTRLTVRDSRARKAAGIGRNSRLIRIVKSLSTPHVTAVLCCKNGRVLSGSIFRVLHETLGAIIMITNPERVRETLGLLEGEPEAGQATHD
jgi:hypothetical protein